MRNQRWCDREKLHLLLFNNQTHKKINSQQKPIPTYTTILQTIFLSENLPLTNPIFHSLRRLLPLFPAISTAPPTMQPCSREMQTLNSLLNHSQISLQDLHADAHHHHHHLNPPPPPSQQIPPSQLHHFDPAVASHDDFLEQMLNTIPSCSWPDLNPSNPKSPWDLNPINKPPRDISDDPHQNQINATSPAAKAAVMLQQQLLLSRGISSAAGNGVADHGLPPMPLSLGNADLDRSQNDVVDGSCFRPPNSVSSAMDLSIHRRCFTVTGLILNSVFWFFFSHREVLFNRIVSELRET